MRTPEPWYWGVRKGWYVQINKKQVPIGADPDPKRDKEGKPVAPPAVSRAYHRLMASKGLTDTNERASALVPAVCEHYLSVKSKLHPNTVRVYGLMFRTLSKPFMKRKFASLRPIDIEQVAAGMETWSDSMRFEFTRRVGSLCRWAKEAGYTEYNIMAGYDSPYSAVKRERTLTDEEFRMIVDQATDLEFRRVMFFMRGTGCRPGEATKITAAHVHPDKPIVVLSKKEHKTGKKTGKSRNLYMPAELEVMVRALAKIHPAGPLFRNSRNGRGWAPTSIADRFRSYRDKLGLGDDVVPYTMRHTTLTRLLDGGTSLQHAAAIAGHGNVNTLLSVYYHADESLLLEAVNDVYALKAKKLKPE